MNNWIEINLPWSAHLPQEESFPYPNLSLEMKEKFGYTGQELIDKTFPCSNGETYNHPIFKEFKSIQIKLDEQDLDEQTRNAKLKALNNPSVNIVLEYRAKKREIDDWVGAHPDFIKACDENEKLRKAHRAKERKLSFSGLGLNTAGIVIEFIEDNKTKQLLIGNLNEAGGVCDDCRGVSNDTIILRYKKVWENEHLDVDRNCAL